MAVVTEVKTQTITNMAIVRLCSPGAARPTVLLRRVGTCSCLNCVVDVEARPGSTIDGAPTRLCASHYCRVCVGLLVPMVLPTWRAKTKQKKKKPAVITRAGGPRGCRCVVNRQQGAISPEDLRFKLPSIIRPMCNKRRPIWTILPRTDQYFFRR